jgi:DNA polymerase-3 subunit epsilon
MGTAFRPALDRPLRRGVVIDCETTGLDPEHDEIIELAMVAFSYTTCGTVVEAIAEFEGLRQPSNPISPEITRLTGISDEMLKGKTIRVEEISRFLRGSTLVIAHNASFDRPFLERFCPDFEHLAWGCSQAQVPWAAEGFEGSKLFYLAVRHNLFFAGHRALDDAKALLELLARPLPLSGLSALATLLTSARCPGARVWALGAPFEAKDLLRNRGYRWNPGAGGRPRAWHTDVSESDLEAELAFLHEEVAFGGRVEPLVRVLTAYNRFSQRA